MINDTHVVFTNINSLCHCIINIRHLHFIQKFITQTLKSPTRLVSKRMKDWSFHLELLGFLFRQQCFVHLSRDDFAILINSKSLRPRKEPKKKGKIFLNKKTNNLLEIREHIWCRLMKIRSSVIHNRIRFLNVVNCGVNWIPTPYCKKIVKSNIRIPPMRSWLVYKKPLKSVILCLI